MAPITSEFIFGNLTASRSSRLLSSGFSDPGLSKLNSIHNNQNTSEASAPSKPLSKEVAKDFQSIRMTQDQPQNKSLLGKIADFIVNKKISSASA